jgi:hypothetical protein
LADPRALRPATTPTQGRKRRCSAEGGRVALDLSLRKAVIRI